MAKTPTVAERAAASAAKAAQTRNKAAAQASNAENPPAMGVTEATVKGKTSGSKVTVAFKGGIPWFDLQLCEPKTIKENTQTGPRDVTQWFRVGGIVRLRGTSYPRGTPPEGFAAKPEMAGGYALNHDVDKEFMEKWMKQNHLNPMVQSKMILVDTRDRIVALCNEHAELTSGLEPMAQSRRVGEKLIIDPRVGRSPHAQVTDLETAAR